MTTDALDVLLIEDNPGDARLIEEMLRDAADLHERIGRGDGSGDELQIHHETAVSAGLDRLGDVAVDVVLLDLNLPDSTGLDTLATVVDATSFVPVVVLTGLRDEQLGIDAIQQGAQDYLVKDEVTSNLLTRAIHHAIERTRQDRERDRRRRQLETLNRLNRIAQDVAHRVITSDTREDIERGVCERLAASDAYRFAWIGEVDRGTDRLVSKAAAGVEDGYLDEVTVTVDGNRETEGPASRAVRTQTVQVVRDVATDPSFEQWREAARDRGYRSLAAVPIVHEDLVYGVLGVYADSTDAFSDPEPEILSRLGDFVGHAIAATERRDVLASDSVLEVEFRVEGLLSELVALSTDGDARIQFETLVRGDESLIAYGEADGVSTADLREAADRSDAVVDVRVLSDGETPRLELVTTAATSLVDAVATHGGRVQSATIRDGEFRVVVEFPPGGDRRKLVELVEDHYPGATPVAQRTVERSTGELGDPASVLDERLTEKQRTALETAYHAGYFDWPRESTGEDIAEQLGVAPPTFTEHLRAAEGKFFETVFEGEN